MVFVISTDTIFVQKALYGVRKGNKTDFVKISWIFADILAFKSVTELKTHPVYTIN